MESKDTRILLVEQDDAAAEICRRNLEAAVLAHGWFRVRDAAEALDFLHGRGTYEDRAGLPLPALVLIDCTEPAAGGGELVRELRADRHTGDLPLVALLRSASGSERRRMRRLGAHAAMESPVTAEGFLSTIEQLDLSARSFGRAR